MGGQNGRPVRKRLKMRFGKTTIAMISILIFCCACDNWPIVMPNDQRPTVTMTVGKDFDCWTTEAPPVSERAKPENVLIFSRFWGKTGWETKLFRFNLLKETTELEVALTGELDYPPVSPDGQYIFYEGNNTFAKNRLT
jgi:hypothetical protein